MSKNTNSEKESFVDPEEYKDKKTPLPKEESNLTMQAINNLTVALNAIINAVEENTQATNALITTLVGQTRPLPERPARPMPVPTPLPQPIPQKVPEASQVAEVKQCFPDELVSLLEFSEKDDHIVIKCRQFLGSDMFSKAASIVRSLGGEYISAGKDSHFRVKKQ